MPTSYCAPFRHAANRAGQGSINTNTTPAGVAALLLRYLPRLQALQALIVTHRLDGFEWKSCSVSLSGVTAMDYP